MYKNEDIVRFLHEADEIHPHFDALHDVTPEKAAADALRKEIRESKDDLKHVGTVYYISNNGDDNNDGKSPETAWRTLQRYENHHEIFDDAGGATLLLERGGIYRGFLCLCSNSAYGAYGEGKKPEIWTSKQNYADEKLWSDCGNDIWSLEPLGFDEKPMWDIGLIAMDAYTIGMKITTSLSEVENDLEFYHDLDAGKLYLMSTKGNPGKRFSSIEMSPRYHGLCCYGTKNVAVDNICVKYAGFHGMANYNVTNVKVTNCEFGWIGGSMLGNYRLGNGIEFWENCENVEVEHCYFYQCYDTAITHQADKAIQKDVRFVNNLIEDCIYGIEFFVRDEESIMENIVYEDNIIRFSGYGWGDQRINPDGNASIVGWAYPQHQNKSKNFVIRNNILSCCSWYLVFLSHPKTDDYDIKFTGNTYYQTKGIHTAAAKWTDCEILPADDQESLEKSIRMIDDNPKEIRFI